MYFICITPYNLIICREKSPLNHIKIMDLKASYWLECDCFTETWFLSIFFSYFVFNFFMYLFMFIVNCHSFMYLANNCCYEHWQFCMSIKTHLIHTTCCCCVIVVVVLMWNPNRGYNLRSGAQPSNHTDCQHSQQVNHFFIKMSINYNFQMLIVFSMSFLFLV